MKETIITNEQFMFDDELYTGFYYCPNCTDKENWVIQTFEFCPFCGVKLIWKLEENIPNGTS